MHAVVCEPLLCGVCRPTVCMLLLEATYKCMWHVNAVIWRPLMCGVY